MQKDKILFDIHYWKFQCIVKNWKNGQKNGQISKNGQACFFIASAFKKWSNFSKLAMKWPIWQPWGKAHATVTWIKPLKIFAMLLWRNKNQ